MCLGQQFSNILVPGGLYTLKRSLGSSITAHMHLRHVCDRIGPPSLLGNPKAVVHAQSGTVLSPTPNTGDEVEQEGRQVGWTSKPGMGQQEVTYGVLVGLQGAHCKKDRLPQRVQDVLRVKGGHTEY